MRKGRKEEDNPTVGLKMIRGIMMMMMMMVVIIKSSPSLPPPSPPTPNKLYDSVAAIAGHITINGQIKIFANKVFADTFMTSREMHQRLEAYHILAWYILAK